jgi:hypothetical protein
MEGGRLQNAGNPLAVRLPLVREGLQIEVIDMGQGRGRGAVSALQWNGTWNTERSLAMRVLSPHAESRVWSSCTDCTPDA